MSKDDRLPSKETVENTVAIGKLTTLQEGMTKDMDRLITHIEKMLPVHTDIANIKKVLYSSIAIAVVFSGWITLAFHELDTKVKTHIAVAEEREEKIKKNITDSTEKISHNKNQITYLKGRIKK